MRRLPSTGTAPFLGAVLGVALTLAAALVLVPLRDDLTSATPAMFLVLAVVVSAVIGGSRASIVTALAAAGILNLAFIRPYWTYEIADAENAVDFIVFLVVAIVVGQLVTLLARRRVEVTEKAEQVRDLDERLELASRERARLARNATRAEELEVVDVQRAALLRSVSHDLRTPLAAIRAIATDLRDGVAYDEKTRVELLTTACDEVDRLDRLVANLLSMSRIEAGAFEPERQAVDLGELVADRIRRLAPLLRDHVAKVDIPEDLPLLDADYGQLEQVVTNLLANAARHGPADTDLWVVARRENGWVRCEVSDRGKGVPAGEEEERIFHPFERGEGSRSSGIGLAICRSIIEAHGGSISVRRTFGGGATFVFTMPVHGSEQ